jgi:hypothetical protein
MNYSWHKGHLALSSTHLVSVGVMGVILHKIQMAPSSLKFMFSEHDLYVLKFDQIHSLYFESSLSTTFFSRIAISRRRGLPSVEKGRNNFRSLL